MHGHRFRSRPSQHNGQPLSVKLGFYLESLGNFRETQMTFDVDLYLYMSWRDQSLSHSGSDFIMVNDDEIRKQLWLPDLYFANARQANFHHVTVPNFNLFIGPDGTVAYSSRVTLSVACNLDLIDYPMDKQVCYIKVLSYAYIAKTVRVTWFERTPILFNEEIGLPEFTISNVTAEHCNGTYRYAVTENSFKLDQFSCLTCNLYLSRALGFNMVQSYIPTGLIVIISWVSFWIDRRAVPARVTLSFTTLLSLTTIGNGMRFALPQVSYAKAIDYWFGGCMFYVFLALLEYAVVNSYMRRSEKYERLSNKFTANREDIAVQSKICSTAYERTYAQMMKMRRKSSAMALIGDIKRNLSFSNPVVQKMGRDSQKNNTTTKVVQFYQSNAELCGSKRKSNPTERETLDFQQLASLSELDMEISQMCNEAFDDCEEPLNGSYYDNVTPQRSTRLPLPPSYSSSLKNDQPPKKKCSFVEPLESRKLERDKILAEIESLEDDETEDESVPQFEELRKRKFSVEPNQELSLKYLEASHMLSRRALNIDKISRYLFPIMFVCFNISYWGYYLGIKHIFN
ncbi:neurotransmitter-gated ion-channel ligand binding domain-containing protein [Ditylenchus destructor]|uniref:Neurotransmitter-gated ion-channel ligand binding domain-containing protein n=1 Tax=Ditylenchus destructor TaxID=166010 RepID=A0AAD4RC57_9BILA|nr:neurotransmitter-gated ion-channel ligand binding domain-containing protein [Ditylenchus destructor]